jgi:hypothetical protein
VALEEEPDYAESVGGAKLMRMFTLKTFCCNAPLLILPFPRLGERGSAYRALVGKIEGKSHVEDLSIDRRYFRNGL